jgi:hypothetical protein
MMQKPFSEKEAFQKARASRNRFLGVALFGLVVLIGAVTFFRLSGADLSRGGFYYSVDDRTTDRPEAPASALPPGMSPDQAAPPPGLEAPPAEEPPQ